MDVYNSMIMCMDTACLLNRALSLQKVFSRNPFYLHFRNFKNSCQYLINMTVNTCKLFIYSGKTMFLADHLSRSYLNETKEALVPKLQVSKIHLTSFLRRKYRTRYGRTPVKMTSYNHSWGHSLGWMAKQQSRPNTRKQSLLEFP